MKNYALITGASKGIGLELAKLFAKDGYSLVMVARSNDLLEKLKEEFTKEYGVDVVCIAKDLSNPSSAKEVYDETDKLGLRIDYLVNNAGFGDYGPFLDCNIERHDNMIQLNITTLINLCYYYGRDMRINHVGKIINIGSIASFFSGPLMSTYYATKAFVLSFSEALSKELKDDGVTVTVICPGTTATNFFDVANASSDKTNLLKKMHPASPVAVAKYGYQKAMKNKVIAIYGAKNRTAIFFNRFISRRLSRSIVYKIQSERKESN